MEYLLLAILSIIVYAEVLPTISMFFELIRTWLAAKITIIQQRTVHAQEDIQNIQARMEPKDIQAVGFHDVPEIELYEGDEDE